MAEGRHLHAFDLHEPTYVSATGIKDIYAGYAPCTCEAEWLAGRRAGDTGRVPTATKVLAEARSWPDAGADKTGGARQARDQIATADDKEAAAWLFGIARGDTRQLPTRAGPAPCDGRPAA